MSQSALVATLAAVEKLGLPEAATRENLRAARDACAHQRGNYGPLMKEINLHTTSGESKLNIVSLCAFLDVAFRQIPSFRAFLIECHAAKPSSPEAPWSLVLYSDEVVPGAQINHRNDRAFWIIYASFLEFGPLTLMNENAWITLSQITTIAAHDVVSGISQIFGALLKDMFCGLFDPELAGIHLTDSAGSRIRLFWKLGAFVMDGAAHKHLWHCKGDAGLKLCMLCLNLYTRESQITQQDGTRGLVCDLLDESALRFATDVQVRGAVRRLAAKSITDQQGIFQKRQTVVGFRHEPYNLLLMPELDRVVKPVSQFCHDPQHTIFVNGVFNTVLFLVLESILAAGMDVHAAIHKFLLGWSWPSRVWNKGLCEVFSPTRVKNWRKVKHVACSASEGLSLLPVLIYFLQKYVILQGICVQECNVLLALGDLVDLLQCIPLGRVDEATLRNSVTQFLQLVDATGWREWCHPKFHWLVHLATHLNKFGFIPTCWTWERKHRCAKRYAEDIHNTGSFDHSVLAEITCHHLALLHHEELACPIGLLNPRPAPRRLREFLTSERLNGVATTSVEARFSEADKVHRKDVVLWEWDGEQGAGEVWCLAAVDDVPLCLISVWELVSMDRAKCCATWRPREQPEIFPLEAIVGVCAYRKYTDHVVTLIPAYNR